MHHIDRYDETYLKNLFNSETLNTLKDVNFTNITTYCTENTLKNALKTHNISGGMLYLSSKFVIDNEPSDGLVPLKSSKYIEEVCKENGIRIHSKIILDGHHDLASDKNLIEQIKI